MASSTNVSPPPCSEYDRVPARRKFLFVSLAAAGLASLRPAETVAATNLVVSNVTGLYSVTVAKIGAPTTAEDVSRLVKKWPAQIAVGGGRFSMGGQVAVKDGLHLDMRQMSRVIWIRPGEKVVRVQAGIRWRDLQDVLDPLGLAVKTMQSYASFTVGGSVSVNAHGRYVGHGAIGNTIRALQLVLADGSVVECSPRTNRELFRSAIGGYGAVGIITEVELELAENVVIARAVEELSLSQYFHHFKSKVLNDETSILHNADLMPPRFDQAVSVTWRRAGSETGLTEKRRLVPRDQKYSLEQNALWAMTELPGGSQIRRSLIHPLVGKKPAVAWLNHEASLDVAELEPRTRALSTYVLQEYFIPPQRAESFAKALPQTLHAHRVEVLNISIRHSPGDQISAMPWAKQEVFCFVIYFKQRTWRSARDKVGVWTRELIDLALAHAGRYYLPYQIHATRSQFETAYPEIEEIRRAKVRFDPFGKFSNELWRAYL